MAVFEVEGTLSFDGHSVEFRDENNIRQLRVGINTPDGLKAFVAELMRKRAKMLDSASAALLEQPGKS